MSTIIDNLARFNRHERFYLVGWALGNPKFTLDLKVRTCLSEKLSISIPACAFVAMDYTLDWLYASLVLPRNREPKATYTLDEHLHASIEDVDLLIAYGDGPTCHIVMLEAKGRTPWSNKQLCAKARRLGPLFEDPRVKQQNVVPHFMLASPRSPRNLKGDGLPSWMLDGRGELPWVKLPIPDDLLKPTRCAENGRASRVGTHWMVQRG